MHTAHDTSPSAWRRLLRWRSPDPLQQQEVRRLGLALQSVHRALLARDALPDDVMDMVEALLEMVDRGAGRLPPAALQMARRALHLQLQAADAPPAALPASRGARGVPTARC